MKVAKFIKYNNYILFFTAKLCRVFVEKMTKKCQFFTFFGVTRQNFWCSRWNITTIEPVLERLLNFWIFGTYFKLIAYLVKIREPPKFKKSKIRVTRKPDLETQNWVYSFSFFIEPYQTHIVTAQMLFDCWTVLSIIIYIVIHFDFYFLIGWNLQNGNNDYLLKLKLKGICYEAFENLGICRV